MKILKESRGESAFASHSISYVKLEGGLYFFTVHLIVRDNVEKFFFKERDKSILAYQIIDDNSIIITDYPSKLGKKKKEDLSLIFEFSTSQGEISKYNYFDMYVHFVSEKDSKEQGDFALSIKGHREGAPELNEDETETGIIYFPDIKCNVIK